MKDMENCGELLALYQEADEQRQEDFGRFLRYCAEHLQEGESVQEIWNGWQLLEKKRLEAERVIKISRHIPMDVFAQAMDIAKVFRDRKMVYIPQYEGLYEFVQMIGSIWYGGYIAGVRAERKRRKN